MSWIAEIHSFEVALETYRQKGRDAALARRSLTEAYERAFLEGMQKKGTVAAAQAFADGRTATEKQLWDVAVIDAKAAHHLVVYQRALALGQIARVAGPDESEDP
jgi:hypothetical protein